MTRLYLGTQGWSYPSWVGPFYPQGTPSSKFLDVYATRFDTVELDTTFYAIPRASTVAGWRQRTPAGFRFSAKFPQAITHEKALRDCQLETNAFVEAMAALDDKLGVLLMQMPPQWGAAALPDLEKFLPTLPPGQRYALEVRHKSWLAEGTFATLTQMLKEHGVALCLVQHAWMPAMDTVTAPFVYIRWLGRREDIPDDDFSKVRINRDTQLDKWAAQVRTYTQMGAIVYGYFNNHYQGHSPASVRDFKRRLAGLDGNKTNGQEEAGADSSSTPTLFDLDDEPV
ncbi:MAG: DUF72 domain-containing protein [Anaerolineae bacterium]|jgi:uncharacterized protein YecE (DUF72 family)|nr:DUF72 domain-containing protein [Anaerolineae bacterium]